MATSTPWTGGLPAWDVLTKPNLRQYAIEWYEERAAIMEFDAGMSRHGADLAAYAMLVERLYDAHLFATEVYAKSNIIEQLDRCKRFRHQWEVQHGKAMHP